MHFSLFELIIWIGVIQGFVIAFLIWLGKGKAPSHWLLSAVLVVFNGLCLKILLLSSGDRAPHFLRYFPLAFDLAVQPLVYLYILSLTRPRFRLRKEQWLHFIPFALSFVYSAMVYIRLLPLASGPDQARLAEYFDFNKVKEIEDYLSILSSLLYWLLGFREVTAYRRWLFENTSDANLPTYGWLRNLAVLFGALILGLSLNILLDYFFQFGFLHFIHWQIFFIYLAVLIYYMGFRGFILNRFPMPVIIPASGLPAPDATAPSTMVPSAPAPSGTMSADSTKEGQADLMLQAQERETVQRAILHALETDKLYLNPELSLQMLAKTLGLNPAVVSAVINKDLKKSFRNLVNEYRVEAVKTLISGPTVRRLSILGIAFECGFNSEASFYRIFKTQTGISPKEYLKKVTPPPQP